MSPEPVVAIGSTAAKVIGAAKTGQALAQYREQELIEAVVGLAAEASEAGRGIIDTAEALLTKSENCRWEDDDEVRDLDKEIGNYLSNHPRLTLMQDALGGLPPLLRALKDRAGRRKLELKPGSKRQARLDAVEAAESALADLLSFVDGLAAETEYRPHDTGTAPDTLQRIRHVASQPSGARLAEFGYVQDLVAAGRTEIAESRTRRISGVFTEAMSTVRAAFAA